MADCPFCQREFATLPHLAFHLDACAAYDHQRALHFEAAEARQTERLKGLPYDAK